MLDLLVDPSHHSVKRRAGQQLYEDISAWNSRVGGYVDVHTRAVSQT